MPTKTTTKASIPNRNNSIPFRIDIPGDGENHRGPKAFARFRGLPGDRLWLKSSVGNPRQKEQHQCLEVHLLMHDQIDRWKSMVSRKGFEKREEFTRVRKERENDNDWKPLVQRLRLSAHSIFSWNFEDELFGKLYIRGISAENAFGI